MLDLEAVPESLIARQVMRMLRREILAMCVAEAVRYGVTAGEVAKSVFEGKISPTMQRPWRIFVQTAGIPHQEAVNLALEIPLMKGDNWDFEDLRLLVEAYGRASKQTPEQVTEVLDFTRRVARTVGRQTKDAPKMDALIRQAMAIPEGERS